MKLIAFDLDGTLLDDDKNLPAENLAALRVAKEAGIIWGFSAGSSLPTGPRFMIWRKESRFTAPV